MGKMEDSFSHCAQQIEQAQIGRNHMGGGCASRVRTAIKHTHKVGEERCAPKTGGERAGTPQTCRRRAAGG